VDVWMSVRTRAHACVWLCGCVGVFGGRSAGRGFTEVFKKAELVALSQGLEPRSRFRFGNRDQSECVAEPIRATQPLVSQSRVDG
jgi:hypothetical protein